MAGWLPHRVLRGRGLPLSVSNFTSPLQLLRTRTLVPQFRFEETNRACKTAICPWFFTCTATVVAIRRSYPCSRAARSIGLQQSASGRTTDDDDHDDWYNPQGFSGSSCAVSRQQQYSVRRNAAIHGIRPKHKQHGHCLVFHRRSDQQSRPPFRPQSFRHPEVCRDRDQCRRCIGEFLRKRHGRSVRFHANFNLAARCGKDGVLL